MKKHWQTGASKLYIEDLKKRIHYRLYLSGQFKAGAIYEGNLSSGNQFCKASYCKNGVWKLRRQKVLQLLLTVQTGKGNDQVSFRINDYGTGPVA